MKSTLLLSITLTVSTFSALAQTQIKYPAVYPFIPEKSEKILSDVKTVTEDPNFIRNFNDIISQNLSVSRTPVKPWTASYWPLSKGTIADAYEDNAIGYFIDPNWLTWDNNYKGFKKRLAGKLSKVDEMTEEELSKLAPSEKYDLLLGDKSFDLTKRMWEYMNMWGSGKENAFIKENGILLAGDNSLDLAQDYIAKNFYNDVDDAFNKSWNLKNTLSVEKAVELVNKGKYSDAASAFNEALDWAQNESKNYVLEKKNSRIAVWEGICNGWATAAGLVPRPRHAVSIRLPNGKNLKFYPADIKGLVSLYYVNSMVQDSAKIGDNGLPVSHGTVSAGLRCNLKSPKKDIWGRFYDDKIDPNSVDGIREARCSGVHPATWHLGLINLIGKQGRSFIVERKVGAAVDNHPMYGYNIKYFNPLSGEMNKKDLNKNIEAVSANDQFAQFRNKKTRYIVGVENTIIYLNYERPSRKETNSEKDDTEVEHKMLYDLELDENFNIIGGQWRALKVGEAPEKSNGSMANLNQNQPNFFWTISKDYKKTGWFDNDESLQKWNDKRLAPPASWSSAAKKYHSFNYQKLIELGNADTCRMKNKKTGKFRNVYCELEENRPQPLINVVNALIELAK